MSIECLTWARHSCRHWEYSDEPKTIIGAYVELTVYGGNRIQIANKHIVNVSGADTYYNHDKEHVYNIKYKIKSSVRIFLEQ